MQQKLETIQKEALEKIQNAKTLEELKEIETEYLGRKQGVLAAILKEVPKLPVEERPIIGKNANIIKNEITTALKAAESKREDAEDTGEFFDIHAPSTKAENGKSHPLSQFIREVEDVFGNLGFEIADGPEVDDEHHNFNALNIPPHHPAREMQDTFWVKNLKDHVLRTQTSNIQIHWMEMGKPPFRIIAPGKTFRKDSDATHSPMFHQVEGLMVDKNMSLSHLKFVLLSALRQLISEDLELRFRLSYFPFTEPSLEVDASCQICSGEKADCKVCKGTGWFELGGAGMVHPNVLKNVGLDPTQWNGFAFGFGIERQVMIRHQIGDLRLFFENDLRFLKQF